MKDDVRKALRDSPERLARFGSCSGHQKIAYIWATRRPNEQIEFLVFVRKPSHQDFCRQPLKRYCQIKQLNVAEVGTSAAPWDCRQAARKPRKVQESESHFSGPEVSSFIAGFGSMGFGTRNRWWSWWGGFQLGQERSHWHQQRECGEKISSVHIGGKVSTKCRKISTNFTKYEEVGGSRVSGFWGFPWPVYDIGLMSR